MGKNFLGLDGLKHFWSKAKTWIAEQIAAEVTAKIAEIVANAPEDLDTLKEIADWISSHANDAAAMNAEIKANTEAISGKADKNHTHIKSDITDFDHNHDDRYYTESEVDVKLSGKADKSDITALANLMNVVYEDITSECSVISNTVTVNAVYGFKQGNRVSLTFDIVTNGSRYAIVRIPQRYTVRNEDFNKQWWNYSIHNQSVIATTNQASEFYVMYDTTVPAGVSFIQTFDYYI